jgi:hypothetical protein
MVIQQFGNLHSWRLVQASEKGLPVTTAPLSVCHARLDNVQYELPIRLDAKNRGQFDSPFQVCVNTIVMFI